MNSEWTTPEHALAYLQMADRIPHRTEGEATLLEEVPKDARRVLDEHAATERILLEILRLDLGHSQAKQNLEVLRRNRSRQGE